MKNLLFLLIPILFSCTKQVSKESAVEESLSAARDKEATVIESLHINNGQPVYFLYDIDVPVKACASDNVGVWQIILQIDPEGKTYPAGPTMEKNKAFWQETNLYVNCFEAGAETYGLAPGEHTLRATVYDRARNETTKEIKFYVQ